MGKGKRIRRELVQNAEAVATRRVLEERAARVKRCSEELNALLKRHRCTVEIVTTTTAIAGQAGGRIESSVNVVPLEEPAAPAAAAPAGQAAPRDPVAG